MFFTDDEIDRVHACMREVAALPETAVGDIRIHPLLWYALMERHERNGVPTTVVSGSDVTDELFIKQCRTRLGAHVVHTSVGVPIDEVHIRLNITAETRRSI